MQWKLNAIPAAQTAAFQFDPLVGLFDLWAFSAQMREFFESGRGRDLFDDVLFARRSTNVSMAEYGDQDSIGDVLGGFNERMIDMTTRMNIIMQQTPKIGRWQGQLFIADQVQRPVVELFNASKLSKDLKPAMESFEKIANLAPQLPGLLEQQRQALAQDMQILSQQVLADAQRRSEQTLQKASADMRHLVNYIFIRLMLLLGGLAAILIVFALLLRRRPRTLPNNP